jgi:hypothetical protein
MAYLSLLMVYVNLNLKKKTFNETIQMRRLVFIEKKVCVTQTQMNLLQLSGRVNDTSQADGITVRESCSEVHSLA